MPEEELYVGKLVKRFIYPDGRLTAMVCVGPDWKVEVFPSVEAAVQFAKDHNLKVEELTPDGDDH